MSRMSEAKSYQSRGRLSQAPELLSPFVGIALLFFSVCCALELLFANLYRSRYLGKVTRNFFLYNCVFEIMDTSFQRGTKPGSFVSCDIDRNLRVTSLLLKS